MTKRVLTTDTNTRAFDDPEYDFLENILKENMRLATMGKDAYLFQTDANLRLKNSGRVNYSLYDLYLSLLPEKIRQEHNCNTCRNFINSYGGLVTIDVGYTVKPALFNYTDSIPEKFRPAIVALRDLVQNSQITKGFYAKREMLGEAQTVGSAHIKEKEGLIYTHLHAIVPPNLVKGYTTTTGGQASTALLGDFITLGTAIREYELSALEAAVTLIQNGSLYRGERVEKWATSLLELKKTYTSVSKTKREAVIWQAVAKAPAGFCAIRSSMLGTLLDDIQSGLPTDQVIYRFNDKMDPLKYQRAQVATKLGNINAAEKLFNELGAMSALERRFAIREDIGEVLWERNDQVVNSGNSVFDKLRKEANNQDAVNLELPEKVMTWVKFERDILPKATKIEYYVPHTLGNYYIFTAGVNKDAYPIMQWDNYNGNRNSVSWYTYPHGSNGSHWNLKINQYVDVTLVTNFPYSWYGRKPVNYPASVLLVLDGAKDLHCTRDAGLAIFSENLTSEFHPVRSTIEAISKKGQLVIPAEPLMGGIAIRDEQQRDCQVSLRVTLNGAVSKYVIDRFE